MIHKAWCSIEEVPYYFSRSYIKFQGHTGWKIDELDQIWARLLGRSQLSNPSDLPCWSTGGLGTALGIWKWRPKAPIRTLFGLISFYSRRVLQRKMCHECIFLWHTCLSHKNVANRTFSTRVLQTVSLVSRLNSRILIRLGALRYVTTMLLRRWAWFILSNRVTSSRILALTAAAKTRARFTTRATASHGARTPQEEPD